MILFIVSEVKSRDGVETGKEQHGAHYGSSLELLPISMVSCCKWFCACVRQEAYEDARRYEAWFIVVCLDLELDCLTHVHKGLQHLPHTAP